MITSVDLSAAEALPVPVDVLRELTERAERLDLTMLVIGAAARDLVVHAVTQQPVVRATLDVDIAVAVDREGLEGFTRGLHPVRNSDHKVRVLGVEVDVVPFGPMERDRHVELDDGHLLDVTGLAEAAATAVVVNLPNAVTVHVASLPGQAALKVLAWRDRHLKSAKDALDLRHILEASAESPYVEEAWEDAEALARSDYAIDVAAAFRTGRLAALPFDPLHGGAVLKVLDAPPQAARLASQMGSLTSPQLLGAFAAGFRTGLGSVGAF
ncbi:hypothetical protein [Ornithinimicrobium flavum]|uniref:hypothetical protein n=1 Tax=Ornithinimicrobium flavum TaxID=1288636 RepID=UPI00106F8348|nr:hypothetical protein [Ornithinimicrobium flavum]